MSRVAQESQAGMASSRSFIERRGVVGTLVAVLDLFFSTPDTCLNFTMLIATDALRHTAMIQAYIALHSADIRTLGEAFSRPHFLPFHLWY